MIFKIKFCVALVALLIMSVARAESDDPIARIAALVSYVGADYHLAISDGKIRSQAELDEQLGLLRGVRDSATRLTASSISTEHRAALLTELDGVIALVDRHASEGDVTARCRVVTQFLVDKLGLQLFPTAAPDRVRAASLFATTCAGCHGGEGRADSPLALSLKPPPVSFFDGDRMSRISPTLAFSALTFGVEGTAMPSFSSLPANDRWSLAFYVIALRHDANAKIPTVDASKLPSLRTLAAQSDRELATSLQATFGNAHVGDTDALVAVLRRGRVGETLPALESGFVTARALLDKVTVAADRTAARDLIIAAYLDGVEPEEAALMARNPELGHTIEGAFTQLRADAETHAPSELAAGVARVQILLDSAASMQHRGGKLVPFLGALTIALREGFEISLLVGALLAFLRKSGQANRARFVHAGWLAAIPAGVLTWFIIGRVLGGAAREFSEAILTLSAAIMLLFVSHVVLGAQESRKWLKFLERRTKGQADRTAWPLFGLAFVAAYREAVEVVLFFRSLALQSPDAIWAIVAGSAVGVFGLFFVVKLLDYVGKRLSPRPVMLASGIVLTVLAVALVGQGVHALQSGGYVGLSPLRYAPSVPVLGLYATIQTLLAQALTVVLIAVPIVCERRTSALATPPAQPT